MGDVLILVLMEYGLGLRRTRTRMSGRVWRLNPCFNGIWSRTRHKTEIKGL